MASSSSSALIRSCRQFRSLPSPSSSSSFTFSARPLRSPRPSPTPIQLSFRRCYAASPFPTASEKKLFRPINVLVMLVPFVTFGLGVWQVKRLRWKLDLIDDIQRNIEKDPLVLPPNINLSALPDFAFRRVLLKGKFEGPPLFMGPAVEQGIPGWNIVLPFSRSSTGGSTILVNRGFLTEAKVKAIKDGTDRPPGIKEDGQSEEVVLQGMLTKKWDEGRGRWTPENNPEGNQWFWKDIISMASWVSKENRKVEPVFVDVLDDGKSPLTYMMAQGEPIGRPPTVEIRNQHATYAVIWFTLSVSTAAMTVYLLRTRGRSALKSRPSMRRI
ncbi:SURF1 family-domain-containing protein [Kockovaella imperatae]|uniref:SURF1-like protein n=1 Tax=Kockovaella imperatae TaxID=4999 RepID=A0A1Y1UR00_9TREE|nr:SURF1 family-domain-containing protein [Kockovaella imperatae]ORX39575.1 SURF1 family-domain-containing protein [Kockovaella imperatae]